MRTWRRRFFVLKDGKLFWFKTDALGPVRMNVQQNHLQLEGECVGGVLYPIPTQLPPHSFLQSTQPRGIVEINKCLSIKGAEDTINKAHAFEVSTSDTSMFFIADNDKVGTHAYCCLFPCPTVLAPKTIIGLPCLLQDKEDWINAVGRAIVRHSRRWVGMPALKLN
jgi:hypothetical protein